MFCLKSIVLIEEMGPAVGMPSVSLPANIYIEIAINIWLMPVVMLKCTHTIALTSCHRIFFQDRQ